VEESKLPLEQLVYSEEAMLELLGIDKKTLDDLRREKGFPFVRLTTRARVYLADEVLAWLKQEARR
jgi:predicted DNA-binding transcriptional regulator AlpA